MAASSRDPAPRSPTRVIAGKTRELRVQRFRVQVSARPDRGLERLSDGHELSIGSGPGNELVLADSAVSRHHCTIAATRLGFLLRDLHSTNGTFVGDCRVEAVYLPSDATIQIGETTLRFVSL